MLELTPQAGILDFKMFLSRDSLFDNTEGLWGNFDGDSSNDLASATGMQVSSTATSQQIYQQFGETCKALSIWFT